MLLIYKHIFIPHAQKEFVQWYELLHPTVLIADMNHRNAMTCEALQKILDDFLNIS